MEFEIYDGLINMYVIENSLYLFVISSSWHRCFAQINKEQSQYTYEPDRNSLLNYEKFCY